MEALTRIEGTDCFWAVLFFGLGCFLLASLVVGMIGWGEPLHEFRRAARWMKRLVLRAVEPWRRYLFKHSCSVGKSAVMNRTATMLFNSKWDSLFECVARRRARRLSKGYEGWYFVFSPKGPDLAYQGGQLVHYWGTPRTNDPGIEVKWKGPAGRCGQ